MEYVKIFEKVEEWKVSDRSVRNYCASGRVPGARLKGKTWEIPKDAQKPKRSIRHVVKKNRTLLDVLREEKKINMPGGIYHKLQIEMTYNSNHIEGSRLTHDQTRSIFETKTIGGTKENIFTDDIIETINHFQCVKLAIDFANRKLTESMIKQFHFVLKSGTSDAEKPWFKLGDYKLLENEVGGMATSLPQDVKADLEKLLKEYNNIKDVSLEDIVSFHRSFEKIHPFQDGNGRVGRLIMFKECLKHNIVPVIITEKTKTYYYNGLAQWPQEKGFLIETCRAGQDEVKEYMNYFGIKYDE